MLRHHSRVYFDTLAANDWPQYLGPSRNGVYVGAPLNEKWPSTGPRIIWRKQVGQGLSGPVVAGKRLILFHRVDDREVVESLDALTGAPQWRHAYPTTYRDDFGFDEGPRAVPVVAEGIVFTYGAEGKAPRSRSLNWKAIVERRCDAAVRGRQGILWRRGFAARRRRQGDRQRRRQEGAASWHSTRKRERSSGRRRQMPPAIRQALPRQSLGNATPCS